MATDVHRNTVCKYEVRLRCARIASLRAWQRSNYMAVRDSPPLHQQRLIMARHCIRLDASQLSLYKRRKLHTTELRCFVWKDCGCEISKKQVKGLLLHCRTRMRYGGQKEGLNMLLTWIIITSLVVRFCEKVKSICENR